MKPLEMWGTPESTLNRIGDRYISQIENSGHNKRKSDLELFKGLGLKKILYPCLWETVAPKDLDHCDWSFLDERLSELQKLDVKIVAKFLHHGSGPQYTSLIDPDFPEKFATYARLFATRYPLVNEFAPIHEINHTAKMSCLKGHWYPHLRNDLYYLKAIIHQCKATILAMKEIKQINPKARFIQSEVLGEVLSVDSLRSLAEFENHRKWLAFDLLCGKVVPKHPLYHYFISNGIREEELRWFEENTCAPNTLGVVHNLMSDRFFDDQLELYPEWTISEDGQLKHSDVAAVDSGKVDFPVFENILKETWERYHIPIAITESHLLGEREAQMRWLGSIWQLCEHLRTSGVQIEAVTASALLGTFAWHGGESFYSAGAFELHQNNKTPVPTGLATLIRELATKSYSHSPVLKSEGHWETARRIQWYNKNGDFIRYYHRSDVRPILILGSKGSLAQAIASACGNRNVHNRIVRRQELDITDKDSIEEAINSFKPWAIINAAGFIHIDHEDHKNQNLMTGALKLAEACYDNNIALISFSSDKVFNKHLDAAYIESNVSAPVSVYDHLEIENENHVLKAHPESLIIRTSAVLNPETEFKLLTEEKMPELQLAEIANHCIDLLVDEESGVVQLLHDGQISHQKFSDFSSETMKEKLLLQADFPHGHPKRRISVIKSGKQVQTVPDHHSIFKKLFDLHLPYDVQKELFQ